MDLLLEIEKNWRSSGDSSNKKFSKKWERGKQELKQLCSSLNFEITGDKVREGRRRRNLC